MERPWRRRVATPWTPPATDTASHRPLGFEALARFDGSRLSDRAIDHGDGRLDRRHGRNGMRICRAPSSAPAEATRWSPRLLGSFLLGMGALHFLAPRAFDRLVPSALGPARLWVLLSGVAEIASGAALLRPSTQRAGAWGAAATLVAVFPGNLKMAVEAGPPVGAVSIALWLRLPLQLPLVVWAARCARAGAGAGPPGGTGRRRRYPTPSVRSRAGSRRTEGGWERTER